MFRPDSRRHSGFKPTFPAGRFVSQPLKLWCSDIPEIRRFLANCRYVSDEEQFGERDHWQPPDQFEESKKGDCEDFALWVWRQLLHMGYAARFVAGRSGRYGEGHAWVTFQKDGKAYLLESLDWPVGHKLPRLSIIRYKPRFSVGWDGHNISYYEHEDKKFSGSLQQIVLMVAEWLYIWTGFWFAFPFRIIKNITRRLAASKSR